METEPISRTEAATPTDPTEGVDLAPSTEADETVIDAGSEGASTPELEDQETDSAGRPEEGRSRRSARDRVQQALRDKDYAIEYAELQRQRAEEFERLLAAQSQSSQAPANDSPPQLEDFDYDQDRWSQAVIAHAEKRAAQAAEARAAEIWQQRTLEQSSQQASATFAQRAAEFAESHPDFQDVAFATKEMLEVIQGHPNAPKMAYELGQLPEAEISRIINLPPAQMALELGVLAAKPEPSKPPVTQKPVTTNAPAPMSPVGGGQPDVPLENLSTADFIKRRNEEDRARRMGR